MLTIIGVFLGGIFLGFMVRGRRRLLELARRLSGCALYSLLFILGLSMGVDDHLMAELPRLGSSGLLFALGGVCASIGCCRLLAGRAAGRP
ncbi:LysO family transporter [Desulfoplanes sp.]